jgi:hypothetical protein
MAVHLLQIYAIRAHILRDSVPPVLDVTFRSVSRFESEDPEQARADIEI